MTDDKKKIDWRAIGTALLITVISSIGMVFIWMTIGVALFLTSGPDDVAISIGLRLEGVAASLIPVALGAWYLARTVDEDERKHGLIFGGVLIFVSVAFGLLDDKLMVERHWTLIMLVVFWDDKSIFRWHDVLFLLAIIPTILVTLRAAGSKQQPH